PAVSNWEAYQTPSPRQRIGAGSVSRGCDALALHPTYPPSPGSRLRRIADLSPRAEVLGLAFSSRYTAAPCFTSPLGERSPEERSDERRVRGSSRLFHARGITPRSPGHFRTHRSPTTPWHPAMDRSC